MSTTRTWDASLDISSQSIELLVTAQGQEVLYAQFSAPPLHPRALPFLLEGLALWSGQRLCVVIYADRPVHPSLGLGRAGDEWPDQSPLLDYMFVERREAAR